MNKKKLIFPVLAVLSFLVIGCGNTTPSTSTGSSSGAPSSSEDIGVTYTVTFNSKGGSAVKKQTIKEGEKATKPTDPTKGGHSFDNWYTEDTYENVYDFNTPVTADITLYANWKLSTSSTLVSSAYYYSTDADSEFSMFTNDPNFKAHDIEGWQGSTVAFNMSWRTIMAVDAEGRLAYAVWCPANGYGTPHEYSYVSHEYYGPNGVGYKENPAIKLGANYDSNNADFEIVIPEGGFIVTGHTNGANDIAGMVTGTKLLLWGEGADFSEEEARAFNKTHGEWSTRRFELNTNEGCIDVYDLATHVTFSGDYSGAFEGDAETATYTRTMKLYAGKEISFAYYDGLLSNPINELGYTIEGDVGEGKAMIIDTDDRNLFHVAKTGNYTFTLNAKTNTFTISREAVTSFVIKFVDILGTAPADLEVTINDSFTLPTPTNVPAGYTFKYWVDADGNEYKNGTYTKEGDTTVYACYNDGTKDVAYSGQMGGFAKADPSAQLSVWEAGTVMHAPGEWIGAGWRFYVVVDAEGRIAYACIYPPSGYGGPTEYTYICHDYYKATGVGYAGNPAIEILEGFGPWEPGGKAHEMFNIVVPEGGFGITSWNPNCVSLFTMITNGVYGDIDHTVFDANKGAYNSSNVKANNTFAFNFDTNTLYSSIL